MDCSRRRVPACIACASDRCNVMLYYIVYVHTCYHVIKSMCRCMYSFARVNDL